MKDENEIRLKRAYWSGVFDALKPTDKSRSEKSEKDRLTAEVWIAAIDWILGEKEQPAPIIEKVENKKR
jgi:hypothetical protein